MESRRLHEQGKEREKAWVYSLVGFLLVLLWLVCWGGGMIYFSSSLSLQLR